MLLEAARLGPALQSEKLVWGRPMAGERMVVNAGRQARYHIKSAAMPPIEGDRQRQFTARTCRS